MDESVEELRPWLPWAADEPQPIEAKVELLRTFRGRFDLGEDFVYGIFDADEKSAVGGTGLHPRVGDEAFEIGYWVRTSCVGRGYAIEAAAALTRVAFELCGVDRVEIRVDPANAPSLAVPRKLGFVQEATLLRRLWQPEPRDVVVWSLFADAVPESPVATARLEAYDAAGARVP